MGLAQGRQAQWEGGGRGNRARQAMGHSEGSEGAQEAHGSWRGTAVSLEALVFFILPELCNEALST